MKSRSFITARQISNAVRAVIEGISSIEEMICCANSMDCIMGIPHLHFSALENHCAISRSSTLEKG